MLAALAVLASINHTHLIKMMRQYGHYADLVQTMVVGSLFFLLCTLSGFFFLFGGFPNGVRMNLVLVEQRRFANGVVVLRLKGTLPDLAYKVKGWYKRCMAILLQYDFIFKTFKP